MKYAQENKRSDKAGVLNCARLLKFKRDFVIELVEKAKLWNEERM